ncbi:ParA family protein [Crateriforma conspicua]|uniref:MinD/ParA/CobQ/CobA-like protein n=1 Tax=Crateriforma conspicua TaxID=2527996 RepID=A0A5C5Y2I6_9PLAN|nr:AAA family ATPase [Crateriforma conspicua]QDV64042.1 MinD/ParA/CobQ/CobA-like protein [Crateriforma conspicua]TWT69424.1 MinD/ParA/CobQ/CobA-like protein [Crateriforma conspicua]
MPTLLMINLKGGVGKTASTVAIAETFAEVGYKTLVIDADHQSMAGELLLGQSRMLSCEKAHRTLHDVFLAMSDVDFDVHSVANYIIPSSSSVAASRPNLFVLPCSFRIDDFYSNVFRSKRCCRTFVTERELGHHLKKQMPKVKKILESIFDLIIVDCPPSIAMQVKMFLRIADGCIIPSIPDQLSVRGSFNLVQRLKRHKTNCLGTLWTLYRQQTVLHREMVLEPFEGLPEPFGSIIPNASQLAGAVDPRLVDQPVASCETKYGKEFSLRYAQLCSEILQRMKKANIPVPQLAQAA